MATITEKDAIRTITTHYVDGAFVESHGREVMDIINPTNGQVIARVTLADEEDARRAIAAAKRASQVSGGRAKKSAWRSYGGCTRRSRRALTISPRRWLRSMAV
jgi:Aldehyde dehydrogenase family